MTLVFTLDFRKLNETLALHYYLNGRRFGLGGWECDGDSGG
jgi:hypothetical protein